MSPDNHAGLGGGHLHAEAGRENGTPLHGLAADPKMQFEITAGIA